MTDPKVKGGPIQLEWTRRTFSPQDGWKTTQRWSGSPDAVEQKATELAAAEVQFTHSTEWPHYVETTVADNNQTGGGGGGGGSSTSDEREVWDCDWSELFKPLWYHPRYRGQEGVDDVRKAFEDRTLSESGNVPALISSESTTLAKEMRLALSLGTEGYNVYAPVLTQHISEGTRGQVKASNAGVGAVTDGATMADLIPSVNKIGTWVSGYEWLKQPAKKRLVGSRVTITQTWLGARKWNGNIYEGGTGEAGVDEHD